MVSLTGEPYTALPTAFLYRQRGTGNSDPSCTCGRPLTASAPADEPETADNAAPGIPPPGTKPDALGDPETQLNAATGLSADQIRELTGAVTTGEVYTTANRRPVRVVGPEFLPDPEEAIDLQSPAPTNGL